MVRLITQDTHALLLYFLDQLPYDEALQLREELEGSYSEYLERTDELQQSAKCYETAARKVLQRTEEEQRALP